MATRTRSTCAGSASPSAPERARKPRPQRVGRARLRPARPQRRGQDDHHQHPDARSSRPTPAPRPSRASTSCARREQVKRSISLTGQSAAVDEVLTGEENLRMMARLSGFTRRERAGAHGELLERFDLDDAAAQARKTYSGGMRRRLDLAHQPASSTPPVMFLDEPTTGLDTRSQSELWDIIRGARRRRAPRPPDHAVPRRGRPARRPHRGPRRRPRSSPRARRPSSRRASAARSSSCTTRDGEVLRELPTDGTLAGLRRAHRRARRRRRPGVRRSASATEPRRRLPRAHRDPTTASRTPTGGQPHVHRTPAASTGSRRPVRRRPRLPHDGISSSAQHPPRAAHVESLIMAIVLPIILMLMFTYVFGGAIDPDGGYVQLRRARHHPALRRIRRGHRRRSTSRRRHDDGHHRPLPHHAAAGVARCITGHVVASLIRNLVATGVVIGVALAGGLPARSPAPRVARRARRHRALHPGDHWPVRRDRPGGPQPGGGERLRLHADVPALPVERLRPGRHDAEWLQWIADNQPITPIIETIRGLLMGTPIGDHGWAVGWCLAHPGRLGGLGRLAVPPEGGPPLTAAGRVRERCEKWISRRR